MLCTSYKNPGAIPKHSRSEDIKSHFLPFKTLTAPVWEVSRLMSDRPCDSCDITRIGTVSHCNYCNQCVYGFDHHCFIFGNCIGINNWRNFVLAIYSILIITFYLSCLQSYIAIQ